MNKQSTLEKQAAERQAGIHSDASSSNKAMLQQLTSTLRTITWIAVSATVTIAALELAFRVAHIGEEEFVEITPVIGFWHAPQRLVTWRSEGFSQGTTNSDGMRDVEFPLAKPAGITRIAILGDSMTEGYQVESGQTFAKQLENKLNKKEQKFQVMNFGMSGMSTVQGLYLFKQRISRYHPDICILAYHVMDNEKNSTSSGVDNSLPRPYCFIDPAGKLMTDWQSYDAWQNSPAAAQYRATARLRAESRIWAVCTKLDLQLATVPWYQQLKSIIPAPKVKAAPSIISTPRKTDTGVELTGSSYFATKLFEQTPNKNFAQTESRLAQIAANNIASVSNPRLAKEVTKTVTIGRQWRENLNLSSEHLKITAAVIGELNQACKAVDCKLMVAALPAPNNSMLFFKELITLRSLAQQLNFAFVDINDSFPSLAPMQESPLYYRIHYTPAGHALVAARLERGLTETGLTDRTR